jgi:release factor glutamine methyltransferase
MLMKETLDWGQKTLEQHSIENAKMESLWLLSSILDSSKTNALELLVRNQEPLTESKIAIYQHSIFKRTKNVPLAYLLGFQEFMGLGFKVTQAVLIPRPETEILVQSVLDKVGMDFSPSILEIGTGSGCMAISIAKARPKAHITATDISRKALEIAKENANQHGVANHIQFLCGDLFAPLDSLPPLPPPPTHPTLSHLREKDPLKKFDIIVSNPPYIRSGDWVHLQKEVQCEPRLALEGGHNGDEISIALIQKAKKYLKPTGYLMLEMGYDQAPSLKKVAQTCGYPKIQVVLDDSKIERVIILYG